MVSIVSGRPAGVRVGVRVSPPSALVRILFLWAFPVLSSLVVHRVNRPSRGRGNRSSTDLLFSAMGNRKGVDRGEEGLPHSYTTRRHRGRLSAVLNRNAV